MDMNRSINIDTRDFGKQEIPLSEVITFPKGIIAFEELTEYVLLSPLGDGKYPMWLQSVQKAGLCFIVFDPCELCSGYVPTVSAEDMAAIGADDNSDLRFLAIAVVPEDFRQATANLKSPLVINADNKQAMQIIAAEDYPLKFPIYKREGE